MMVVENLLYPLLEGVANIKVKLSMAVIPLIALNRITPINANRTNRKFDAGADTDIAIEAT